MAKKENKDNCIHVINFKNETIKPMDNFELSMWLNEFSNNKNNDLSKKKYLTQIGKNSFEAGEHKISNFRMFLYFIRYIVASFFKK